MFSTLSSYIYLPALDPMIRDLGVSLSLINLSVTTYMIMAHMRIEKFLDWKIKKFSAQHTREGQYRRGDDITDFPIDEARFAGIYTVILPSATSTAGYGVSLSKETAVGAI